MTVKTLKFKVRPGAEKQRSGGNYYAGEIPKSGSYRVTLKRLMIRDNKNNDKMIVGLAEINEPAGTPAAKYNGYGIWFQQNITDQGAGWVNGLLDALTDRSEEEKEEIRDAFWNEGIKITPHEKKDRNGKDQYHIKKIGDLLVNSPEIKGIEFIVAGRYTASAKFGDQLKAVGYLPLSAKEDLVDEYSDEENDEDLGVTAEEDDYGADLTTEDEDEDEDEDEELPF